MGGKIKKFFLNFERFNKPAVLAAVFFSIFLGLALPCQFVQAQGLLGAFAALPMNFFTIVILQPILLVSNLVCGLARIILGWVVGPYFTTLPYTHGGVVEIGWPLVRDFINMFFVIALAVIGLATALRIKEYQAQKTLPILIAIAILINFTPVICGLVVDASNILMNFFLERLTGFNAMAESFDIQRSMVWELVKTPKNLFDLRQAASALGQSTVMIIFDWVAAYIFFIFSLLFIMRYVMIWALVIVSPIAFFSKIFPGSQKHLFKSILGWDEWWEQFIEWSLLGVIAGFFLYLAEQLMMLAPGMISGLPPGQGGGGWIDNPVVDFVNNFLPWLVVLVFLWIGYKITKSISAMGAQGLMKTVDTGVKLVATAAIVAATGGAAAGLAAKGLGGMARGAQRMEAAAAKLPGGKVWTKPFTKPISWATRGMERAAAPTLLEYQAKTRRVPEADLKKIDGMSGAEAESYINAVTATPMVPSAVRRQRRVQYMARLAEKETLEDTSSKFQEEAKENARSIFKKGDPYYQKEAMTIAKNLPDTFEGPEGEKAYIAMKSFGKKDVPGDNAKTRAENEAREEIKKTREEIKRRLSDDDLTTEVGLKLKYIFEEDVTKDKAAAIAKVKADAARDGLDLKREMEKVIDITAPTATFVKEFKPEDVKKLIEPNTLANRIGLTLGNPRNLQRIQDAFGRKKFESVIKGRGGLDDATNTPEKLDKFAKDINPSLAQAIRRSPAYREIDVEARKHMLDPNDQPTTNPDAFERRIEIQKKLEKTSPLLQNFNNLHIRGYQLQRKIEDLQLRGKPTVTQEKRLESILQDIAIQQARIERNTNLRTEWEEIENLRRPPSKRRRP